MGQFGYEVRVQPVDGELDTSNNSAITYLNVIYQQIHVLGREGGRRDFAHPAWGAVAYEQLTLVPAGHADHKLVMLLPWPTGAGAS